MLSKLAEIYIYIRQQLLAEKSLVICLIFYLFASLASASRYLYNWDAGQFALATVRFSMIDHQPHPPGYYLFVKSAKILNLLFNDINLAFVFINLAAGLLTIIFLYKLIKELANEKIAAWGTLLFIVNPVFWWHHSIAVTYTFEALTAALLSYFTFLAIQKNKELLPLSVFLTTIIAGFRPPILIIALPFLATQLFISQHKLKSLSKSIALGLLGLALWLPLFIHEIGGTKPLYDFVLQQLRVAKNTTIHDINQKIFLLNSWLYAVHLPLLLLLIYPRLATNFIKKNKLFFIIIAIIWQMLVYAFLHFGEVGYIISIIPLFYLLIIPIIEKISTRPRHWQWLWLIFVLLEITIFIYGMPLIKNHKLKQINLADMRSHDARIANYINFVEKYPAKSTLIILLRGEYLTPDKQVRPFPYDDIRLLTYYLPQYKIYDLLGVVGIYFVAEDYRYTQTNSALIPISSDFKNVVFLADYIYPQMLPKEITLQGLYDEPNPSNIYWGELNADEFKYNGMTFKKNR